LSIAAFREPVTAVVPQGQMREVQESSKVDLADDLLFGAAWGGRLLGRRVRRFVCKPQRPQPLHVLVDGRFLGSVFGKALFGLGSLFFGGLFEGIGFAGHVTDIAAQTSVNQCLRQISQDAVTSGTLPISDREAEFGARRQPVRKMKEAASCDGLHPSAQTSACRCVRDVIGDRNLAVGDAITRLASASFFAPVRGVGVTAPSSDTSSAKIFSLTGADVLIPPRIVGAIGAHILDAVHVLSVAHPAVVRTGDLPLDRTDAGFGDVPEEPSVSGRAESADTDGGSKSESSEA
jgi:hypothetical protein